MKFKLINLKHSRDKIKSKKERDSYISWKSIGNLHSMLGCNQFPLRVNIKEQLFTDQLFNGHWFASAAGALSFAAKKITISLPSQYRSTDACTRENTVLVDLICYHSSFALRDESNWKRDWFSLGALSMPRSMSWQNRAAAASQLAEEPSATRSTTRVFFANKSLIRRS